MTKRFLAICIVVPILCILIGFGGGVYTGRRQTANWEMGTGEVLAARTASQPNAIACAALEGDTAQVKWLLDHGASLSDNSFANGMTLAAVAAYAGHSDTVSYLLKQGLNPDIPDRVGQTALSMAVLAESFDTVHVLLEHGANPQIPNIDGDTPLHDAAIVGSLDIAKLLVSYGAKLDIKDRLGKTPAMIAQEKGFANLVGYLGGPKGETQR